MALREPHEAARELGPLAQAIRAAREKVDVHREQPYYPAVRRGAHLAAQAWTVLLKAHPPAVSAGVLGARGGTDALAAILQRVDELAQALSRDPPPAVMATLRAGTFNDRSWFELIAKEPPTISAELTELLRDAIPSYQTPSFYEGFVNGAVALSVGAGQLGFTGEAYETVLAAIEIAAAKAWFATEGRTGS
jgi:hypothetical protein